MLQGRNATFRVDELELALDIMARQPTDLPLPHPVHGLIAVDRSAYRTERAEFGLPALLDSAVVLSMMLLRYCAGRETALPYRTEICPSGLQ